VFGEYTDDRLNKVGIELQEECPKQQAYVHTVNVGIGGYYYIVYSPNFQTFINVQRRL